MLGPGPDTDAAAEVVEVEDEMGGTAGAGLGTRGVALKAFSNYRRAFRRSALVWGGGAGGLGLEERRRVRLLGSVEGPGEGIDRGLGATRARGCSRGSGIYRDLRRSRWLTRPPAWESPEAAVEAIAAEATTVLSCKVTRARPTLKG